MTDLRKAAEMALEVMEYNRANGTPNMGAAIEALRQALAQPEQEPVDKTGSPCTAKPTFKVTLAQIDKAAAPEFWDWLPKAYNFDGDGSFTKYNMEVAFLAGQQSTAQQPPIAWMGTDFEGNPTKFRLNPFSGSFPLYTAPPKREWVGLTDEDLKPLCDEWRIMYGGYVDDFAKAIEAKLKEKNGG